MKRPTLTIVFLLLIAGFSADLAGVQSPSSPACRFYDTALVSLSEGRVPAAMDELRRVESCEDVNTRALALLTRGQVFLRSWPRQFAEAKAVGERLTTGEYLQTPAAPSGFILLGMIAVAERRDFQAALDQFSRVSAINFPPSEAFAEALYRAAEVHRLSRQTDLALRRFREVTLRYPRTIWTARALIGAATCHVERGEPFEAMEALQRVRREFPRTDEATTALQRNTILHRLAMRPFNQTAQFVRTVGGKAYRGGVGLTIDRSDRIILGYRDGLAVFSGQTFEPLRNPALAQGDLSVTAIGVAPAGGPVLARQHVLMVDTEPVTQFNPEIPREEKPQPAEINAFVADWKGDWLIADGRTEAIHRYSGGKYAGVVLPRIETYRMAQNDLDDLAVLNASSKDVQVYGRDGKPRGGVLKRGKEPAYEFGNPMDIAFDVLGNLYVLDGGRASIYVFDPKFILRTVLQLPVKAPTPLRKPVALVVDRTGRLFVLDGEGQQQILVYQ